MSPRAQPVASLDARASAFIAALPNSWAGYRLGALLGSGSTGVVLEGRDPNGRAVAVKVLWPRVALRVAQREVPRFDHVGIEHVWEQKTEDGLTCRVRELLRGRSMARLTSDGARLGAATVLEFLEEMLDALAAAHGAGVAHLDLRASNVFLADGEKPRLKLLDFGLNPESWLQADDLSASLVTSCPDALAPEQAQGLPVGPTADLYAAGCLAFEWLTGVRPYRGASRLEVMLKHVTEPTPRVSAHCDVPAALDAFVHHLMSKQAGLRPKDGGAARQLLRSVRMAMDEAQKPARVIPLARPMALPARSTLEAPPTPAPTPPPSSPRPDPDDEGASRSTPRGLAAVLMLALAGLLTPMLFPKPQPMLATPTPRSLKWLEPRQAPERESPARLTIAAPPARTLGRSVARPTSAMLSRSDRTPVHGEKLAEKIAVPLP